MVILSASLVDTTTWLRPVWNLAEWLHMLHTQKILRDFNYAINITRDTTHCSGYLLALITLLESDVGAKAFSSCIECRRRDDERELLDASNGTE